MKIIIITSIILVFLSGCDLLNTDYDKCVEAISNGNREFKGLFPTEAALQAYAAGECACAGK